MRSVHTLASVHVHWGATSLPCLARGTPGRFNCLGVSFTPSLSSPPWLHGRYPLPRYYGDSDSCSARSGTEQVSLVHTLELLDIPSPTTPCAPVCRHCFGSGRLGQRFALGAIVSSSDFAHHMQAHQSHQAESSLCRRVQERDFSTDYPFTFSCSPRGIAGSQLLSVTGGKFRQRGTFTLLFKCAPKRT